MNTIDKGRHNTNTTIKIPFEYVPFISCKWMLNLLFFDHCVFNPKIFSFSVASLAAIILMFVIVIVFFLFSILQYLNASRIYQAMDETKEENLKEMYGREGDKHFNWAIIYIYCTIISFMTAMYLLRVKIAEYEIDQEMQRKKKK